MLLISSQSEISKVIMIINKQVILTAEISREIVFRIPSSLFLDAKGVAVTCSVEVDANTC